MKVTTELIKKTGVKLGKSGGYPTTAHRRAIAEHGPCVHHRMSFALLPVAAEVKK